MITEQETKKIQIQMKICEGLHNLFTVKRRQIKIKQTKQNNTETQYNQTLKKMPLEYCISAKQTVNVQFIFC